MGHLNKMIKLSDEESDNFAEFIKEHRIKLISLLKILQSN